MQQFTNHCHKDAGPVGTISHHADKKTF